MKLSLLLPVAVALLAASVQTRPTPAAIWLADEGEPDIIVTAPLDLPRVRLAAASGDLAWFRRELLRLTLIDPGSKTTTALWNEYYRQEQK